MTMYDFFNSDPYGAHMKAVSLVGYNKKVLEVGCATGQISRRLTANGCEVIGVEIDEERAKEAKKYCRYVILQDVENLDDLLYNNYFDCILFIDVLEHLKYPLIVLEKLKP
jgi:2-polyprenyl-3-methyl-5-hydroxy-6-metoxy-1,4-benzoquinol methylase